MAEVQDFKVRLLPSNRNRYFWDIFMEKLNDAIESFEELTGRKVEIK
jgi:hypothetical protein